MAKTGKKVKDQESSKLPVGLQRALATRKQSADSDALLTDIIDRRFPQPGKQSIFSGSESLILRGFGQVGPRIIDSFSGSERRLRIRIYRFTAMPVRMHPWLSPLFSRS